MSRSSESLVAEQVIASIVVDLADAFDCRDERRWGELLRYSTWRLAETGQAFLGTHGAEVLMNRLAQLRDGPSKTQHDVCNVLVEVEPDNATATVRSEFAVLRETDRLPLQFVLAGHYDDRFVLRDGRWRLVEREEHWDLLGELEQRMPTGDTTIKPGVGT